MNTYKFTVEIYVRGESETDALETMQAEFDYLFGLDNNLLAAFYPEHGEEVNESVEET